MRHSCVPLAVVCWSSFVAAGPFLSRRPSRRRRHRKWWCRGATNPTTVGASSVPLRRFVAAASAWIAAMVWPPPANTCELIAGRSQARAAANVGRPYEPATTQEVAYDGKEAPGTIVIDTRTASHWSRVRKGNAMALALAARFAVRPALYWVREWPDWVRPMKW